MRMRMSVEPCAYDMQFLDKKMLINTRKHEKRNKTKNIVMLSTICWWDIHKALSYG